MLNTNKYKIRLNPLSGSVETNITFSLKNGAFDFIDYTEDNTELLTTKKEENVNPFNDGEKRLYKPTGSITASTFVFNFFSGGSYYDRYTFTNFDLTNDILALSDAFVDSFYVMQVFDSFVSKNQTKLHTGYYNNYEFAILFNDPASDISSHLLPFTLEALQVYLPVEYVNSITTPTFDLYMKFFFYNAKLGKFLPFYKNGATVLGGPTPLSVTLGTEEDIYMKLTFTKATRTYDLGSNSTIAWNQFNNTEYNDLINSTVDSIPLEAPVYPSGNTFTISGNYVTLD